MAFPGPDFKKIFRHQIVRHANFIILHSGLYEDMIAAHIGDRERFSRAVEVSNSKVPNVYWKIITKSRKSITVDRGEAGS
jgi:hypothetical protein